VPAGFVVLMFDFVFSVAGSLDAALVALRLRLLDAFGAVAPALALGALVVVLAEVPVLDAREGAVFLLLVRVAVGAAGWLFWVAADCFASS
jgi:hypothetical protein